MLWNAALATKCCKQKEASRWNMTQTTFKFKIILNSSTALRNNDLWSCHFRLIFGCFTVKVLQEIHSLMILSLIKTLLRDHLHMAKNLSTKSRRSVNEVSMKSQRRIFLHRRSFSCQKTSPRLRRGRIFNFILIFFCKTHFFCNF